MLLFDGAEMDGLDVLVEVSGMAALDGFGRAGVQ